MPFRVPGQRLADNRAKGLTCICDFHGVAARGRGSEEIPNFDRRIGRINLAIYLSNEGDRGLFAIRDASVQNHPWR